MVSGGARARSGPVPDPSSGRSDSRGVVFRVLPTSGRKGSAPRWPLTSPARLRGVDPDERDELNAELADLERALWRTLWRTPQAVAWAEQSWRLPIVAEYCRMQALVQMFPDASASLIGQLHRYREQLGLTPAGLSLNGWRIGEAEKSAAVEPSVKRSSSRARLKAV